MSREPKIDPQLRFQLLKVLTRGSIQETVYTDNPNKAYHQIRGWLRYHEAASKLEFMMWIETKRIMKPGCLIIEAILPKTVEEVVNNTIIKRVEIRKARKYYEDKINSWKKDIENLPTNRGYTEGTPEQQRDIREQWDTILQSFIYAQDSWQYDAKPDTSYLDIWDPLHRIVDVAKVIKAFLTGEPEHDDEA